MLNTRSFAYFAPSVGLEFKQEAEEVKQPPHLISTYNNWNTALVHDILGRNEIETKRS